VTLEQLEQSGVNAAWRADDVAALVPAIATGEIRDDAAGFRDEQRPGCDVPRCEMQLEKAVEDAACGVGEIERRGPGAAYTFCYTKNVLKNSTLCCYIFLCTKWKAGRKKRSFRARLR